MRFAVISLTPPDATKGYANGIVAGEQANAFGYSQFSITVELVSVDSVCRDDIARGDVRWPQTTLGLERVDQVIAGALWACRVSSL